MDNRRGILTFPSSRKAEIITKIMDYVRDNDILKQGIIIIDDKFKNALNLSDLSASSIDNSIEWLEFFKIVIQNGNKPEFRITDKGKEFFDYYNKNGKINTEIVYYILIDTTMPYKIGCTYNLKDKKYRVFETMFKVFINLEEKGYKFDCRKFDEVYYFKLNDNNYKNYEELCDLIVSTNSFTHERPVIDYLFSTLELFGVIEKEQSYIYILTSNFKKLLKEKLFINRNISNFPSDNKVNPIGKFKDYYLHNLDKYKKDKDIQRQIYLRYEFIKEYPISKIRKLSIAEYALGVNNKETLSHKLEFGKYSTTGCGIGGNTASKHGFYKKADGNYYGRKNEIIDNPEEYWNEFINQLADYYTECKEIKEPLRASSKYPLLKGMNMVLTKVSFLYYPTKFVSICSKQKLQLLMNYFGYEYNKKMQAEELSYLLNKYLRSDIKELSQNDPQIMGDALWDYLKEYIEETEEDDEEGDEMAKGDIIIIDQDRLTGGYNKIVYGIPGCGKSYYVKNTIIEKDKNKGKVFTTTFYPDYTNGDFIGQIIPKLNGKDETSVMYDIQAGPFAEALLNAIIVPNKNTYLIVEEINRGNAAAIFGDMFQLLDRLESGMSQYAINNYLISTYLHKKIDNKYAVEYDLDNIKLPSNLILIGTMNTSDQNVFTLDTAFKRRWKMEYIKNDVKTSKFANEKIPLSDVTWAEFVEEINNYITSDNGLDVNGEDKQIGAYFISDTEWKEIKETTNSKVAAKIFAEKLLSYIWEDVAKINKDAWFDKEKYRTLDSLVTGFMEKGLEVFNDNISFTRDNNGE